METVLKSDDEEQVRGGETREEEEEEEEEDRESMKLEGTVHGSALQEFLSLELDQADNLCPEFYRVNTYDENQLLAIADNFQRQYSHLYPDRKPLLLCPINEYGVKKFVSTTIRPSKTYHIEFHTWEFCATFVADFLSLDPLEPPVDLPRRLFSPSLVLQRQRASCFESATLLCSLLLGNGFEAYCVSGYAVKEMCLSDQSLQECPLLECPLLDTEVKSVISEQEPQENKYKVKPLRELKSRFVTQQEKKKEEAAAALLQKLKLQEESEQRPADPLRGLRVHCWVLVLKGRERRHVQENFFIDPLTGKSYSTDDDNFLGVESVWNEINYYVNKQDCTNGCADMVYDLEDLKMWEPVLYGAPGNKRLTIAELRKLARELKIKANNYDEEDKQPLGFVMPRSWVSDLPISKKDLETRFPGGQKVIHYKKAKVEKFAVHLRSDGLVTRLTTFKDLDCTEVVMVKEWYQYREDRLEEREVNKVDNFTTERFNRFGRRDFLLFHRYTDTEREMEFSSVAHRESLVRRVESPGEMTETFEGRLDFLYYRNLVEKVVKGQNVKKVVERFHRNKSKPANADVAERVFLLDQRRIEINYHLLDRRFINSKRIFIKPQESTENEKADYTCVSSFRVDPYDEPLATQTVWEMPVNLRIDEEEMLRQISASKDEIRDILACRRQEEADVQLYFPPWTTTGVARALSQKQEKERQAAEEQRQLKEKKNRI